MNLLDLFSGIGGFSLGLERAGFTTVAMCEIDPWCRRVLAKHWPQVPIYDDVRNLTAAGLRAAGIRVDAICGGFPCQDISTAGKGAGLDGERSGLWREFARLIGDVRPEFAIVENVGALRGRGLGAVLGDLAALGYDAEWHAIPAAAVGAPHLRDRVWIVAIDADAARRGFGINGGARQRSRHADQLRAHDAADASGGGLQASGQPRQGTGQSDAARGCAAIADANGERLRHHEQRAASRRLDVPYGRQAESFDDGATWFDSDADGLGRERGGLAQHDDEQGAPRCEPERLGARRRRSGQVAPEPERERRAQLRGLFGPLARALSAAATPWPRTSEPPLCGLDDGLPARLARPRLKALGNAVVPAIPEIIGRAVLERVRMSHEVAA